MPVSNMPKFGEFTEGNTLVNSRQKVDDAVIVLYTKVKALHAGRFAKLVRQNQLYDGENIVINKKTNQEAEAICTRNMVFELIETQISNNIPLPKVTPRKKEDTMRAQILEEYLKNEMDRLNSEEMNDLAERGVYKHGSHFYYVYWDTSYKQGQGHGRLGIKEYSTANVMTQPGIRRFKDCQYLFLREEIPKTLLDAQYNCDAPENSSRTGMCTLITLWYLTANGTVGRYGWIDEFMYFVFAEDDYFSRKVVKCTRCGEILTTLDQPCWLCGSTKQKIEELEEETAAEDIIAVDKDAMEEEVQAAQMMGREIDESKFKTVLIAKDGKIPFYKLRELPFILRVNISNENSIFGISDIDIIKENQENLNKVNTKMTENIIKSGTFVTYPKGVKIPNTDATLKMVAIDDARQVNAFSVQQTQANVQQEQIFSNAMYEYARASLGITDSYQGKRDTTAESGKAKQVAAAQSAGRLESKRRMKEAAYQELFSLCFKFFLSYADQKQTYLKEQTNGQYSETLIYRYNFLKKDEKTEQIYWEDNFNFDTDTASILSTNREAMWQETTQNFQSGALGNPQDPQTLMLYWRMMDGLDYPLAKQALAEIKQRAQMLPIEVQQLLASDPQLLQSLLQAAQAGASPGTQASQTGGGMQPQRRPLSAQQPADNPMEAQLRATTGEKVATPG